MNQNKQKIIDKQPLVSVLIPCYNQARFLGYAIQSVLDQTYQNFEILVCNDCSTDNFYEVINKYNDKRIKIIENKTNLGVIRSRNRMLQFAKGEYICPLDSDDVILKNKLQEQVDYLEQHRYVAAVFSDVEVIDENNEVYIDSQKVGIPRRNWYRPTTSQTWIIRNFFEINNFLAHCSALIRSGVMQEIGDQDLRLIQTHDFDLWTRIVIHYPIHVLGDKLAQYRKCSDGTQTLSTFINENIIRECHESVVIIKNMISNMSDELFEKSFERQIINKKQFRDITCEKFLLLRKWEHCGVVNKLPALLYYEENYNEEFVDKLERLYNYTIKDYYSDTGEYLNVAPINLSPDYIKLDKALTAANNELYNKNKELNQIYNSKSWKYVAKVKKIKHLHHENKNNYSDKATGFTHNEQHISNYYSLDNLPDNDLHLKMNDDTDVHIEKFSFSSKKDSCIVDGWVISRSINFNDSDNNVQLVSRPDLEGIAARRKYTGFSYAIPFNDINTQNTAANGQKGSNIKLEGFDFKNKRLYGTLFEKLSFCIGFEKLKNILKNNSNEQNNIVPEGTSLYNFEKRYYVGQPYDNTKYNHEIKPIAFYNQNLLSPCFRQNHEEEDSKKALRPWHWVKQKPQDKYNFDIGKSGCQYGYDTESFAAFMKQIELAKFYGIYAFAICVDSENDINNPDFILNIIRQNQEWDFHFCVLVNAVLLCSHYDWFSTLFDDRHFLKVEYKPVVIVRQSDSPTGNNVKKLASVSNDLFAIRLVDDSYEDLVNYDAHINSKIPNSHKCTNLKKYYELFCDTADCVYDYEEFNKHWLSSNDQFSGYNLLHLNRKIDNASKVSFVNYAPSKASQQFKAFCNRSYEKFPVESRFVFIDSWNGWIDDCKLEPDNDFEYGNLQAIKDALETRYDKRLCFYTDQALVQDQNFINLARQLHTNFKFSLYLACDKDCDLSRVASYFKKIRIMENNCDVGFSEFVKTNKLNFLFSRKNIYENNKKLFKETFESTILYDDYFAKDCCISDKHIFMDKCYEFLEKLGFCYKKVSVAVPNYKYIKYLRQRIDSIVYQTYPVYEVILMDDASDDGCELLYDDYIHKDPVLFSKDINKKNSGSVSKQWAKAFRLSKGDYLWIAEADDFSKSRFLEKNMAMFERDNDISFVNSRSCILDENGECTRASLYPETYQSHPYIDFLHWGNDYVNSGYDEIAKYLAIRCTIHNVSAVVFKKSDYRSELEDAAKFKNTGDWYFYVSVLSKGCKIGHSADNLNCFTLHDDSLTLANSNENHYNEIVEIQKYACSFLANEDIPASKIKWELDFVALAWGLKNS